MASDAQINANRNNAQHSTGPRTSEGRNASSKNAITTGLYTRQDYVKPEERDLYADFFDQYFNELSPVGIVEQTLANEIAGAAWRLRRCSLAEGELADYATIDPLLDESKEKSRRSIDRARTSSNALYHRALNQLRKLQTERVIRIELNLPQTEAAPLADTNQIFKAMNRTTRSKQTVIRAQAIDTNTPAHTTQPRPTQAQIDQAIEAQLNTIMGAQNIDWDAIMREPDEDKADLGLNCESGQALSPHEPVRRSSDELITRNLPCECGSGRINRQCCGLDPVERTPAEQKAA
jgi:hypothetical protein